MLKLLTIHFRSMIIAMLSLGLFSGITLKHKGKTMHETEHSLNGATGWFNTKPLSLPSLHGKVVLVDFWTFTCINWRRTLPYVRAWKQKYQNLGLVVVGVHTPEFSFEHSTQHIQNALKDMHIDYPVAVDNQYEIWNSFQNQYWPALYLIDTKGRIRFQKFGEGDYKEIEQQIQKLLKETGATPIPDQTVDLQPEGYEAAPDWDNLASPENFLGYSRSLGFNSPERIMPDKPTLYSEPKKLKLNQWGLSGAWIIGKERVRLTIGQGTLIYRFQARDLHLIMGPAEDGTPVKFRISINGLPPGKAHGVDVDSYGYGEITTPRMYQLVRQPGSISESEFRIEFLNPNVDVYDFTFG